MKYTTSLTGLEFYCHHGLYAEEKVLGAVFRVDISIERELDAFVSSIEEATNYEIIFNVARAQMSAPQDLLETVAQNILTILKQEFPQSVLITVTIHKPNPAGLFKSGVASVTISG
jgi:dihydroneopterin aldolase